MSRDSESRCLPLMEFPELADAPIRAAFSLRLPGLPVSTDKQIVMAALAPWLDGTAAVVAPGRGLITAEQTHGKDVAVVTAQEGSVPMVDGLLTARRDRVLAIAVADCCPVWLWAPDGSAIAVVHAGRMGTEAGIAVAAADLLARQSGHPVASLGAFLGPCIRPPHYEVDIPALLHAQLAASGVCDIRDCGLDTALDLGRFYSYRTEKGHTGRMIAFGWLP